MSDSETQAFPPEDEEVLEELVAKCISALEREGPAALEQVFRDHPGHAERLRERMSWLSGRGLVHRTRGDEPQPEFIGPFRVIEKLGEGAMGLVYKAEQREPVRRSIAVKVVKLGMDSREVLARFENERSSLAAMNHSNIAKVFDAGTTDRGQPYFAMELVEGQTLTTHCDKHRLSLEARIELFRQICDGVQHAHQKGIVHRDLKPGNIMVVREGDRAIPKILDFGLVKATNPALLARTVYTEQQRILGTPEYMAPEQASGEGEVIDTRTDVYSLGVILYELLTGQIPFDSTELRRAGWAGLQKTLAEVEPKKPSDKLSNLGAGTQDAADKRRTSGASLQRHLRNDLDWIVLKAMSKEQERRYGSASELAADLGRYLNDEPVLAGPPSASYRLRKLFKRHRVQFVAGALVFVSLVAGVVGTTIGLLNAEANRIEAERQGQIANDRADEVSRQREEIQQTADQLRERTDEFDMLADVVKLEEARRAERDLYPGWPDLADKLEAWLRDHADGLTAARPHLQATVAELESRALPWTEEQREADRLGHPRFGEWRALASQAEALEAQAAQGAAQASEAIAAVRPQLIELEDAISQRRTWEFESEADQFLHRTLADLAAGIGAFEVRERKGVEERLFWSRRIGELTSAHPSARTTWAAAREAIATADGVVASTLYRDPPIELTPQTGLVPIGMNPATKLWEFYHLRSAWNPTSDVEPGELEIPRHSEDGAIEVGDDTGVVFVLLPGGTFTMGSQAADPNAPSYDPMANPDEPPHTVTLAPFLMARHEVTQGQWERLAAGERPSGFPPGYQRSGERIPVTLAHPVDRVSWLRGDEILRAQGLLLPTEAQWEYACRALTTTPFSPGARLDDLERFANVLDQRAKRFTTWVGEPVGWEDGYVIPGPVGSLKPNAFGLHDMHGNLNEWVRDWMRFYSNPVRAGDGLREGRNNSARGIRGGSFWDPAFKARSSARSGNNPEFLHVMLGLRASRPILDS